MLKRTLAVAAALSMLTLAACSDDDGDGDSDARADDSSTAQSSDSSDQASDQTSDQPSDDSSPAEEETSAAAGECTYTPDGMEPAKQVDPPAGDPTAQGKVDVTIETSFGDVRATLNADKTPCTVNSFLSLAEQDYFDDTQCHRLTTEGIYVLQCGDPTATGMGGPGYQFDDELTGKETYPAGTLAMANAGPGTNGSQFFMVYEDTQLDPAYTVFGKIDAKGVKLVQGVAAKGTDSGAGDGAPKQTVTIDEIDD